ncbi:hypothetical protein N9895_01465 [Gammaproteobacteria bacterium]|nr:hypothetical protein [Gammaproteobacteria bacterium]
MESIIKEKIKDSHYHKFSGIAPEGFVMIPEKTLERLKDFDFLEGMETQRRDIESLFD